MNLCKEKPVQAPIKQKNEEELGPDSPIIIQGSRILGCTGNSFSNGGIW
jgi:hypothetical protein